MPVDFMEYVFHQKKIYRLFLLPPMKVFILIAKSIVEDENLTLLCYNNLNMMYECKYHFSSKYVDELNIYSVQVLFWKPFCGAL